VISDSVDTATGAEFIVFNGSIATIYRDGVLDTVTTIVDTLSTGTLDEDVSTYIYKSYDGELPGEAVTFYGYALDPSDIAYKVTYPLTFNEKYKDTVWTNTIETKINLIKRAVVYNLRRLTIANTTPANTNVKYILSPDGIVWYYWHTGNLEWTLTTDISLGNTSTEYGAITVEQWYEFRTIYRSTESQDFKIKITLYTEDDDVTPSIEQINFYYDGYEKVEESDIKVEILDNFGTISTIRNISGGTINDIVVYTFTYQ